MGAARSASAVRLALALIAVAGAVVVGSGGATAARNINAKHFFWAPGQDPTGTVSSLSSDIIYHGGSAGPGGRMASPLRIPTASSTRARRCRTT